MASFFRGAFSAFASATASASAALSREMDGNASAEAAYASRLTAAQAGRVDAARRRRVGVAENVRTDVDFIERANAAHRARQLADASGFETRPSGFRDSSGGSLEPASTIDFGHPVGVVACDERDPWSRAFDVEGRAIGRRDAVSEGSSRGGGLAGDSKKVSGPRVVRVEILAARNLEAMDAGGTSDPYAVVTHEGEPVGRTKVKRRTLNPVWGERFFASASKTLLGSERVLVALYDHDVLGSHDHLGSVEIPIEAVEEECPRRNPSASIRAHWVRLGPPPPPPRRDRGRAKLAARFDPDVPGRLHVWVVGAVGLEAADSNGSSDPYVRVTLLRHLAAGETAKRDDRRRTATRFGTLAPAWDERFVFEGVEKKESEGSAVLFELFDHDSFGADDAMGQIVWSVGDIPTARERDHRAEPRFRAWEAHGSKARTSGEVLLVAYFADARKTRLRVRVVKARNIKAADVTGTSDAYVVGTLRDATSAKEDQVFRTKVVEKTVAPAWRHEMFFRVKPSTRKQIRDAERRNVGAVWRTALGVRDAAVDALGCGSARVPEKNAAGTTSSFAARCRGGRDENKNANANANANDGFVTDVKTRDARRDVEREMVTDLARTLERAGPSSPGGARANDGDENESESPSASSAAQNVAGQSVVLDLFDRDEGLFDADDFLGRVVLPLERVPTRAEGGDKRGRWHAWRERGAKAVTGDVLVRCYFPHRSSETNNTDAEPAEESAGDEDEDAAPRLRAALASRLARKAREDAAERATRSARSAEALRRELEAQLRMQLLFQAWPPESAEKYARAYAEHGHESRLVPPPPEGCTVPASFAHAFETAETAERRNAEERALESEAAGGSNDREEPGSPDERPEESNPKGSVSNPEGSVSEPKGPGRVGSDAASDVSGGAEAETGSLAETMTPRGGDAVRRDAALVSASVRRFIADAREEEARREAFAGAREAMRAADEAMRARRERGTAAGLRSSADATNDEHRRRVEANDAKGEGEGEGEGRERWRERSRRRSPGVVSAPRPPASPADDLADAYPTNTRASVPEGALEGDAGAAARLEEAADARGSAWAEVFRKRELEMARVKARAERSDVVYS